MILYERRAGGLSIEAKAEALRQKKKKELGIEMCDEGINGNSYTVKSEIAHA